MNEELQVSRILVVDDDASAQRTLLHVLRKEKYRVEGASSGLEALRKLQEKPFDVVITDVRMERMDGMELMHRVREGWPGTPVIVMTAFASVDTAIRAIHEGACDYVSKPYEVAELRQIVVRALEQRRLASGEEALRKNVSQDSDRGIELIGMSPLMVDVYKVIARVAPTGTTVVIEGESGSGKELVARAIHANSDRARFPFVAINCGSLSETLLESELFGHVKGAFTGASYTKQGLFEFASRGTVFLDEIGETSPSMQTRLLRVIEEREVHRVGSMERIPVDIRVIAATNRSLQKLVSDGTFREDLSYRLNVVTIKVPALRDRMADLPLLFDYFVTRYSRRMGKSIAVQADVIEALLEYRWPGNVRELENMVERAVTLNTSGVLRIADFSGYLRTAAKRGAVFSKELLPLDAIERQYIEHVIACCDGNMSRAAEVLCIDRRTLYRTMERWATGSASLE